MNTNVIVLRTCLVTLGPQGAYALTELQQYQKVREL